MSKGVWYGIAAQVVWGLSPVYWKQLDHLPAPALIIQRILWSSPLLAGLTWLASHRSDDRLRLPSVRVTCVYAVAATLLSVNWLIYVWAVTTGLIVEASLGYFITPLVSVALGVLVLRERLRPGQSPLAVSRAASSLSFMVPYLPSRRQRAEQAAAVPVDGEWLLAGRTRSVPSLSRP